MSSKTGEAWADAELHRLRGAIRAEISADGRTLAEENFHRALEIARSQSARHWELRAAASLARLWATQGRRAEAHDLLIPIRGRFPKASIVPDLAEADLVLSQIR